MLASEYLDHAQLLRRLAARLRACPTPESERRPDPTDQPYTNAELALLCERVAQDREDEAASALRMISSGAALTPQQMVDAALGLAAVETNSDVSVSRAFMIGLAEIAQHAIAKHAQRRVA